MANWILTVEAKADLYDILQAVSEFTGFEASAVSLFNDLKRKFDLIAFMPFAVGRKRGDGLQEAFCRGYRIVYRVVDADVYILTVIHSSKLYPQPKT